jgi:SLT domain-containing protein
MELFSEYTKAKNTVDNLVAALDAIRRRYGFNAIRVGRTL